jgi:hypothetical protein
MINEVAYSPDIIWVSYGADKYDPAKFKPIDYDNQYSQAINKPFGGVWASPENSEWGWADWCRGEDFRDDTLDRCFKFRLSPSAKIYVIDKYEDLAKISTKRNYF